MDFKILVPIITALDVLQQQCTALQDKIEQLQEKTNTNSENSSLPPSKSYKKKKKRIATKKRSKRKQGAQIGHDGKHRALIPTDQVNKIIVCEAQNSCSKCGRELQTLTRHKKHQVLDLENNIATVTEYQIQKAKCTKCRKIYTAELPQNISTSAFGANLSAYIALLVCKYHLSKRNVMNCLEDFFGINISVGSVSNIESRISQSLEKPYDECKQCITNAKVIHIDETRHYENNETYWNWVAACEQVTLFYFDKSRGAKVAKTILGENSDCILCSDRYAAYNFKEPDERQICWAHLKRDFTRISQRSGIAGKLGDALLCLLKKMFKRWQRYKQGKLSFESFQKVVEPIRKKIYEKIISGTTISHQRTANTCANFLKVFDGLWTFSMVKGVEPTNNHAEQQLRPYVIYRKLSFGTQSSRGSKYLQRCLTVLATCKKQCKNFVQYVQHSLAAWIAGTDPPVLLA
jgi:transposase